MTSLEPMKTQEFLLPFYSTSVCEKGIKRQYEKYIVIFMSFSWAQLCYFKFYCSDFLHEKNIS